MLCLNFYKNEVMWSMVKPETKAVDAGGVELEQWVAKQVLAPYQFRYDDTESTAAFIWCIFCDHSKVAS